MSTCETSIGDFDGETVEVWHEETRRARKAHPCYECRAGIRPGDEHAVIKMLYERRWETYRICLPCYEIHKEFTDGGITLGILWESMREQVWEEGSHILACLGRVPRAATKAKLRDQWMQWKGLEFKPVSAEGGSQP